MKKQMTMAQITSRLKKFGFLKGEVEVLKYNKIYDTYVPVTYIYFSNNLANGFAIKSGKGPYYLITNTFENGQFINEKSFTNLDEITELAIYINENPQNFR